MPERFATAAEPEREEQDRQNLEGSDKSMLGLTCRCVERAERDTVGNTALLYCATCGNCREDSK